MTNTDRFPLIERALRKQSKADIIELILVLAKEHASLARDLEKKLAIEKPINLLVVDVSAAIDRATDFDDREINDNFDVNWPMPEAHTTTRLQPKSCSIFVMQWTTTATGLFAYTPPTSPESTLL